MSSSEAAAISWVLAEVLEAWAELDLVVEILRVLGSRMGLGLEA